MKGDLQEAAETVVLSSRNTHMKWQVTEEYL